MPTNPRPCCLKFNAGQGAGCAFMLEQGVRGDFAIIAKPGWSVAWEEVGLCWFKVIVRGDLNYTGVRHVIKGRNPIVHAAKVIGLLEEWFSEYTRKIPRGWLRRRDRSMRFKRVGHTSRRSCRRRAIFMSICELARV